jgi:hypothetical protein
MALEKLPRYGAGITRPLGAVLLAGGALTLAAGLSG